MFSFYLNLHMGTQDITGASRWTGSTPGPTAVVGSSCQRSGPGMKGNLQKEFSIRVLCGGAKSLQVPGLQDTAFSPPLGRGSGCSCRCDYKGLRPFLYLSTMRTDFPTEVYPQLRRIQLRTRDQSLLPSHCILCRHLGAAWDWQDGQGHS